MHDTTKPSPVVLTELSFKMTFLLVFTLLLVLSFAASEAAHIDCRDDVCFTSPNYPLHYPNLAVENRLITAPDGIRILVTFTDFNVEVDDFLDLADNVYKQNSKRYTGEHKFPPFLTKGNELDMTFISLTSGTRRGFNVSASCYDQSRDANVARIVGGNSPGKGFLELRTQLGDWRRVCTDSFHERVAEVVCGELGYPAVKKVSNGTGDCISAGQDCTKAPVCNDYTFRSDDCSWSSGNCSSADAVKVECYEPGYKGCYHPEDLPQLSGAIFNTTSQCVSSCRTNTRKALAVINGKHCFCPIADEVNLPDIAPAADHSTCIQNTRIRNRRGTRQVINSLVYDVSVGFCDALDDVIHGSRDSNITWFGSIVRFTCDAGYSLNGCGALQCVPGLSPYYPVWNGSVPTCNMSGDSTSTSSTDSTLYTEEGSDKINLFFLFLIGPFIGLILCVVALRKWSETKSLVSLTESWTTHLLDGLCYQSGNEMSETEPENHCSLMEDCLESPPGHEHSLPTTVQVESNQLKTLS
eukprot:XP_011678286.1 PREDICTED: uncharacterized protein LOC105444993 isoform X2 [Strongylocentrotus purpuratus]